MIRTVLLLGFVAYGLSINFYIKAQKDLGAAKTSAYYSIAPFLGVVLGLLFLGEQPAAQFYLGLVIMIAATESRSIPTNTPISTVTPTCMAKTRRSTTIITTIWMAMTIHIP